MFKQSTVTFGPSSDTEYKDFCCNNEMNISS